MEFEIYELEAIDQMDKSIIIFEKEIVKINVAGANPQLISSIKFDYYGEYTAIEQMASISSPEAQQLLVKPYDISVTKAITAALVAANLDFQVINEGSQIRIKFSILTTETRKELVKKLAKFTEGAKVVIRQIRQNINKDIKKDDILSEDQEKQYLNEMQKITDKYIAKIDEITKNKEKELLNL